MATGNRNSGRTSSRKTGTSAKKTQTARASSSKGSGRGTAKSRQTGRKTASARTSSARKSASRGKRGYRYEEKQDFALKYELILILLFAGMVFLFLANFGVMGAAGNVISSVLFGLFGFSAYLLPVFLFFLAAFWVSNREQESVYRKIAASAGLYLVFGIVCEMVSHSLAESPTYQIAEIYLRCAQGKTGGGVVGGSLAFLCYALLKTVGTVLLLIVVVLVCIVILTERSLFGAMREGREPWEMQEEGDDPEPDEGELPGHPFYGREASPSGYSRWMQAREERKLRREAEARERETRRRLDAQERTRRMEEREREAALAAEAQENNRILRMDRKVSGVTLNTLPHGDEVQTVLREETEEAWNYGAQEYAAQDGEAENPERGTRQDEELRREFPDPAETEWESRQLAGRRRTQERAESLLQDELHEITVDDLTFRALQTPLQPLPPVQEAVYGGIGVLPPADRTPDYTSEAFADRIVRQGYLESAETERENPRTQGQARGAQIPENAAYGAVPVGPGEAGMSGRPAADAYGRAVAAPGEYGQQSGVWYDTDREAAEVGGRYAADRDAVQSGEDARQAAVQEDYGQFETEREDSAQYGKDAGEPAPQRQMEREDVPRGREQSALQGQGAPDETSDTSREREVRRQEQASGNMHEISPESGALTEQELEDIRVHRERPQEKNGQGVQTQGAGGTAPRPQAASRRYSYPPLSLLTKVEQKKSPESDRELKETALRLQETLRTFGVNVTITDISQGPAVTRYELQPEQGVKVSKIVSLQDDIKLNLAATDIRIEAPIPGKAAIGIEVPNKENTMVAFRDLVESQEFQKSQSRLSFAVGKDIGGKTVVTDIAKMPHLLIAGSTGSGKSVCINTLIMSVLYKATPDEVRLIMIDPKVVELSVYNGIPHLMIPVVTDPKKAAAALNWAVAEMTARYQKFADAKVRDLKGYNAMVKAQGGAQKDFMPQIVIVVDELADLMMVSANEVEEAICRLAQLARAAGIHLIIATQRPSVDVITGLIKANMPSRIAFAVSSGVDSRTILDMNGAEKLLGKGDMLFYPQGYPKPARIQGAFVSDQEVGDVAAFLKRENRPAGDDNEIAQAIENIANGTAGAGAGASGNASGGLDEHFADAGRFVIEKDKASIGMLQRVYKIGFNRAARIMDQLCEAGVVSEEGGTKPRRVLMSLAEFEAYLDGE
ncbi:MAG: DNA translocase FtsK 4TM domain-containing protein [Eubacteriales bacterium]|nr:DNA translocase FtsK 4TM domain-containing protein [Eubacteriales bacterium]